MHIKKRRFVWKRDAVERCNKNLRSRRVSANILLRSLISHLTSLWGAITRCTRESALAACLLGDPLDTGNWGESALIEVWAKKNECDAHSKPDSDQICRGCLRSRNAAVLEKQSHACFWGERIAAGVFLCLNVILCLLWLSTRASVTRVRPDLSDTLTCFSPLTFSVSLSLSPIPAASISALFFSHCPSRFFSSLCSTHCN